jgi:hypothetical protein
MCRAGAEGEKPHHSQDDAETLMASSKCLGAFAMVRPTASAYMLNQIMHVPLAELPEYQVVCYSGAVAHAQLGFF